MTAQLTSAPGVHHGIMGDVATADIRQTLVGRDAELAELSSLLGVRPPDLDASPTPRAVLLAGDAGVGKTRLLTELRDLAVTDGWQVVAGHCLDFGDSALPYLPFSEVMGRLATDLPDVVETVSGVHPALGRLQPGRRMLSGARQDAGSVDRGDLFEAMHSLLSAAAAKAPLLLVIEDAHWADQSTRDMISFLFSRPFADPVGIVVSYRAEDLHRRHPLRGQVAEWSRVRGVDRLQLNPLSDTEVRTLVRELHPDPITEADLSDIVTRAEGNAFFVEELVGTTWGGRVPEDLAEVLLVRLDRLDDSSRQVVRAMSVAGRQVSHGLLAEASGVPADALDQALRAAVESHVVITSQDRYSFRHALLAEAIYDDLLPGERVRLHASYAEALRDGRGRGTAAELARHALAARDLPTALEASIRAGDEAMAVGGPEEAAHHFQQALELVVDPTLADPVDVSALVLKTADALVATGMPHRAAALVEKHLEATTDAEPDAMRARLHAYVAHTLSLYDNDQDWRSHLDAARALTPEEPTPDRARLLAIHARVLWMNGSEEAKDAAMEALALAETHNLPRVASDATTTLVGLNRKVPMAELAAALEDAARRARETGAVNSELRALYLLGRGYQDRGHLSRAVDVFRRASDRAVQAGTPWAPWAFDARFQQAQIAYIAGEWDRVLTLTNVDGQAPPPIAEAMLSAFRTGVLSGRGAGPDVPVQATAPVLGQGRPGRDLRRPGGGDRPRSRRPAHRGDRGARRHGAHPRRPLARDLPGPAAALHGRHRRAGRQRRHDELGGAHPLRRRRGPAARRRAPGRRQAGRLGRLLGPGGQGLGPAPRGRGAAVALGHRPGRPDLRGAGRRLGGDDRAVPGVRSRARGGALPDPAGGGAAVLR